MRFVSKYWLYVLVLLVSTAVLMIARVIPWYVPPKLNEQLPPNVVDGKLEIAYESSEYVRSTLQTAPRGIDPELSTIPLYPIASEKIFAQEITLDLQTVSHSVRESERLELGGYSETWWRTESFAPYSTRQVNELPRSFLSTETLLDLAQVFTDQDTKITRRGIVNSEQIALATMNHVEFERNQQTGKIEHQEDWIINHFVFEQDGTLVSQNTVSVEPEIFRFIDTMLLSPNGRFLLLGGWKNHTDDVLAVVNAETATVTHTYSRNEIVNQSYDIEPFEKVAFRLSFYVQNLAVWSPDGDRLIYVDELGGLQLIDAATGSQRALNDRGLFFGTDHFGELLGIVTWSPDGQHVAAYGKYRFPDEAPSKLRWLHIIDVESGEIYRVGEPLPNNVMVRYLAWEDS